MKIVQIITPDECRAARALLNIGAKKLEEETNCSVGSVRNFEVKRLKSFVFMEKTVKFFNAKGIFFEGDGDDVIIRMKKTPMAANQKDEAKIPDAG